MNGNKIYQKCVSGFEFHTDSHCKQGDRRDDEKSGNIVEYTVASPF